jgi:dephospho-CoA kinase
MLQIGITGGIGTGKSTVSRMFGLLGIPVYDSDTAAKRLMVADPRLIAEIKQHFGAESYSANGALNREYLSSTVFPDPEKVKLLNSLVHPAVGRDYAAWAAAQKSRSLPYVLKEAALIFEAGIDKHLDRVITINAPQDIRLTRLRKRDPHRSEAELLAIIERQLPAEEHLKRAHFVVYNDDKQPVIPQVLELHRQLSELSETR